MRFISCRTRFRHPGIWTSRSHIDIAIPDCRKGLLTVQGRTDREASRRQALRENFHKIPFIVDQQ